jgi:uncharacterized protein YbjT (DUF2867 family)
MKVLMVGATGKFAGYVLPELIKRGVKVRALVRDRESERVALDRGADETVLGDLEDARCLISAAVGADGVFHINPAFAPREAAMGVTMVNAAKAAGVTKFVFSSVIHPSITRLTNHAGKQPVEQAIYDSGMKFTVLQPAMFMQNMEASWPEVMRTGKFALPYSKKAKACYVDYRDVAEAAAMALTGNKLEGGTFEMCAPGTYNRIEVAALMSDALGRKIEAGEVPFEDWAHAQNLPEGPVRAGLKRMYADYHEHGFPGGNGMTLRCVLGREARTLKSYFQELAGQQRMAA